MKNSNISGWKDVFSFTFIQTMKSKAFLISYVITLLIVALGLPVVSIFTSQTTGDSDTPSPINKVYIENKTALPDINFTLEDKTMSKITFVKMTKNYQTVSDRIQKDEKASVILTISLSNGVYALDFVKAGSGPVKEKDLEKLGEAFTTQFDAFKISALGITSEQTAMIQANVDTKVSMLNADGTAIEKKNTKISETEYWFIYGILFVVLMVNSMASGQIATSIVTEKSTRVIEYLLTSVKPLALIVGKIIATLSAVLLQMVSLIVVFFISNKVSASISGSESMLSKYLPTKIFENLNIVNITFCLICILLGLIFYATLAGLAGATVSKLEEIQQGLTIFTFANIIGAYIGLAAINVLKGAGDSGFVTFAFLFPLSSPFLLPGSILAGKTSVPIIAASIALQIVFVILLFRFTAKVFETLILHNGSKIKLQDVIKISKTA